jgi:hypothetical protein
VIKIETESNQLDVDFLLLLDKNKESGSGHSSNHDGLSISSNSLSKVDEGVMMNVSLLLPASFFRQSKHASDVLTNDGLFRE